MGLCNPRDHLQASYNLDSELKVFPLFLYKIHIWKVSFAHELLQQVFSSLHFLYSQIENCVVTKIAFKWSLQLMNRYHMSFRSYLKKNSNTWKFHIWMVYFPHGMDIYFNVTFIRKVYFAHELMSHVFVSYHPFAE